ncbi:MAG TPA: ferric reductase-like transmembrane domain-containing protein [Acidimicrobiales bacterium]
MTSSQWLWYTTRGTGIVALVLLSASVVLGVLTSVRLGTRMWPRFTIQDLHRRVSLLAMVFVGLHVVTTVSDAFAPIGWLSVVVPFTSPYRRLWLGLGTVAVDLLLAVTISSLLRQRINPRTWRALHWLAYASWPLAVVHGLGTGTDPHLGWAMVVVVGCVAAVLGALAWRLASGWPAHAGTRLVVGTTSVVAVMALAAWTATGPLRPGWAARAGTPAALLGSSKTNGAAPPAAVPSAPSSAASPPTTLPAPPYRAALSGTVSERSLSGGSARLEIKAETSGSLVAEVDIVIIGTPAASGGLALQQSQASFGPPGAPTQYQGHIVGLDGSRMVLSLADQAGSPLDLRVDVTQSGTQVGGELTSITGTRGEGSLGAHD